MPESVPVPPILPIITPPKTEDDSSNEILEEEDIEYDEGITAAGAAAQEAKKPRGEVGSTAGTPTTIPVDGKASVESHPGRARRNLIKSKDMA